MTQRTNIRIPSGDLENTLSPWDTASLPVVRTEASGDVRTARAERGQYDGQLGDLEPGDIVAGRHVVLGWVADLPLGHLYLARHASISTLSYLVKVLKPEHLFVPELVEQFRVEATTVAQLSDAHTVRVTDMGTLEDGRPFLCREYYPGIRVDDLIAEHGAQTDAVVRHIALGVLSSLSEAHRLGIVHRNIQPRGLLLGEDPGSLEVRVRVLDFGAAYKLDGQRESSITHGTSPSLVLFAPQYSSPECLRGSPTPASDVYSLGLTLAELLEGRPVYDAGAFLPVAAKQLSTDPVPLGERTLASALAPIILRATAKSLDKRYADAAEILQDLLNITQAHGTDFRRSLPADFIARNTRPILNENLLAAIGFSPSQPDWKRRTGEHTRVQTTASDLLESAPTAEKRRAFANDATDAPQFHEMSRDAVAAHAFVEEEEFEQYRTHVRQRITDDAPLSSSRVSQPLMTGDRTQLSELEPSVGYNAPTRTYESGETGTVIQRRFDTGELPTLGTAVFPKSALVENETYVGTSALKPAVAEETIWKYAVVSRPIGLTLRLLLVVAFIAAGLSILFGGLP